jgi:hypothetical protein
MAVERGRMEDSGELFQTLPPSSEAAKPLPLRVGDPGGAPVAPAAFPSSPFIRLCASSSLLSIATEQLSQSWKSIARMQTLALAAKQIQQAAPQT